MHSIPSMEYTEYEDEEWGTLINGTWTGILAVLKSKVRTQYLA